MITQGLMIAAIGMGMVYLFFILIIVVTNLMGKLVTWLNKKYPDKSEHLKVTHQNDLPQNEDSEIALVIAAVKHISK